jgi:hypothetical protein
MLLIHRRRQISHHFDVKLVNVFGIEKESHFQKILLFNSISMRSLHVRKHFIYQYISKTTLKISKFPASLNKITQIDLILRCMDCLFITSCFF